MSYVCDDIYTDGSGNLMGSYTSTIVIIPILKELYNDSKPSQLKKLRNHLDQQVTTYQRSLFNQDYHIMSTMRRVLENDKQGKN